MSRMNLNSLIVGRQQRPLRIALYGVDGIGKSTFAAAAPAPIFISAEDGTAHLDAVRFPNPEHWQDILEAIGVLYHEKHEFQTVVLDSIDWAEQIARDAVCVEKGVTSIEDIPFGKGWVACQEKISELLRGFDALYAKGMNIILVAHTQIRPFNDPNLDVPFDRYTIKMEKRSEPLLREWSDYVLFANWDTTVSQKTDSKGNAQMGEAGKAKAKSYGKRLLHTQRAAGFDAKRRFDIPDRLPLLWADFYSAHQSALNQPTTTNRKPTTTATTGA